MMFKFRRTAIFLFLIFCDTLSITLSFILAYHIRFYSNLIPITKGVPDWIFYLNTLYFAVPIFLVIFYLSDFYTLYFVPVFDEVVRILKSVTFGMLFVTMAVVFYREYEFSRVVFSMIWLFTVFFLFFVREFFKIFARVILRRLYGLEKVLIVGKKNNLLKSILKSHAHLEVFYISDEEHQSPQQIKNFVLEKKISQIILLHLKFSQVELMNLYDWCEINNVELKILPEMVQICMGETSIDTSLGIPMLHIRPVNLSGVNFYFKRFIDIFISSVFLSLLWPFLLLVIILITMDSPGPIFYKHKRVGYRGKQFNFYKFRSMVQNAENLLDGLKKSSERSGPVFKMANDPRVTRFGSFIRRFSLDEIPQIFNVMRGDMSLVGPRPQVIWEAAYYDDWAKRRLRVLPGVTGLWQVSGRADLNYEEMIELDIYYIERWSLGLDIKILFKTIFAIISKRGSY